MLQTPMKGVAFNGAVMTPGAPALPSSSSKTSAEQGTEPLVSSEFKKFVAAAPSSDSSSSSGGDSISSHSSSSSSSSGRKSVPHSGNEDSKLDPNVAYIVERIALGQQMVEAAGSLYGDRICFHFDQQLLGVDFDRCDDTVHVLCVRIQYMHYVYIMYSL